MSLPPRNNDEALRDQLVAYLDGELPDAQAEAIESRLASDDALREQMQGLDRVWNALDGLPRATVDDKFTRTTIEMVAVEAQRDVVAMTAALPVKRRRRLLATAGASVGAVLLGFALVRAAVTKPDRVLLSNLPVIYRVDALQEVGGPDFLRQLPAAAEPLLAAADGDKLAEDLAAWRTIADGDRESRSKWVAALSDNDKAKLLDAARRYTLDLTPARRAAVEGVYAEIAAADDRDELMQTALAYESWLASQPASDQSRLRQMDGDERLNELRQIARNADRQNRRTLSPEDAIALRKAVQSLAGTPQLTRLPETALLKVTEFEQRIKSGEFDLPEDRVEQTERFIGWFKDELKRQQRSPAWAVGALASVADGRSPWLGRWQSEGEVERGQSQAKADWEVVQAKLLAPLSPAGKELVSKAGEDSRRRLAELVMRASRDAMRSVDLEEFFASEELTDAERHSLLGLPTEQMEQQLRRMYMQRVLGDMDQDRSPEWMRGGWGLGRGGQPFRGPREDDDNPGRRRGEREGNPRRAGGR